MRKIYGLGLLLSICLLWIGCEKPPIYDDTPQITWGSFEKDTIQQFTGIARFRFNFTDGDGDLGKDENNVNDTTNHVIIVDTRRTPNDTLFYQIPTITQQGVVSGISGELEITVSQLCGINPNNPLILCSEIPNYFDPVVYKIRIKDNAGRWSNEVLTDTMYIKCF